MSTTGNAIAGDRSETGQSVRSYLAEHPRMIGVLFILALLLAQAGEGVAAGSSAIAGP